ncbi:CUE domain-containing protein 2 isoform 1-T2 [Clarias gariepinus]|uniref:CUE domain-containing protein 2 n=1 Tax=Clarias gariepinus TaxID=13013 RepID=UPI00234C26EC|nr:CUE domain-containing protein 2 [Clarias gariepinus]XP_053357312.1 CUE domain-containing protein 2 [Clarias gariepinus]
MEIQKIIHDALYDFVRSHIPHADLSTLDDVLLSYIIGVLEDLGSQASIEENFDVEVFVEMLEAYIPGFSNIDCVQVCEMMFSLASKLPSARNEELKTEEGNCSLFPASEEGVPMQKAHSHSSHVEGATAKVSNSEWDEQEQHLLEMFPKCSVTEARSALSIAKGDMEEAVRLIIEGDVQLSPTPPLSGSQAKMVTAQGDEKLKANILEKYMLIDSEEDKKIHRPFIPKDAPKKMVRYHGNQVVTTKGERYHLVKKDETEEMKKTYVSLKPARKYRFH